ncbi:adenylyltransferase/cytidyltransferase family protein [Ilumatobacter sp.]|uniref:adenylyltransferase/cytidyltransferase family protein n=1 Tax=Ilumatobacter sp. TaxID=1967498 RepID=UPI00375052CC
MRDNINGRYRRAITYGTFDLFHYGHLQLLRRTADLAEEVIVGVATDEFNALKGKRSMANFEQRAEITAAMRMVTSVIPEDSWEQKRLDIVKYDIDLFVMGDDWEGRFDDLSDLCAVIYLPRTTGISSTAIRDAVHTFSPGEVVRLKDSLTAISEVLRAFDE